MRKYLLNITNESPETLAIFEFCAAKLNEKPLKTKIKQEKNLNGKLKVSLKTLDSIERLTAKKKQVCHFESKHVMKYQNKKTFCYFDEK